MDRTAILQRVQQCVRDALDGDDIVLTEASTATDVMRWDSLAHVRIILAVEREFGIRFDVDDLNNMDTVGALVSSIEAKVS